MREYSYSHTFRATNFLNEVEFLEYFEYIVDHITSKQKTQRLLAPDSELPHKKFSVRCSMRVIGQFFH